MSALVRMGLRLAAIELLRADPVFAAMTSGRIFDSEIAELQPQDAPMPVVLVHTEKLQGKAFSANNGGPPFDAECDLAFELAHVASIRNDDGEAELFRPVTTAEMEAGLDVMESRLAEVLAFDESALGLGFRRFACKRILEIESERFATDEAGVRLASRLVKLTCELHVERPRVFYGTLPTGVGGAQQPAAGADTLPTGAFAALPEPLASLAALMPADGYGRAVLLQAAALYAAPTLGPAFTGANITQDFGTDGQA